MEGKFSLSGLNSVLKKLQILNDPGNYENLDFKMYQQWFCKCESQHCYEEFYFWNQLMRGEVVIFFLCFTAKFLSADIG